MTRIISSARTRMLAMLLAAFGGICFSYAGELYRDLPEGYRQLTYLKSTGTQWIDSGVTSTAKISAELDYSAQQASGKIAIGHCENDTRDWRYFELSSTFYFDMGSARVSTSGFSQNKRFKLSVGATETGYPHMVIRNESGALIADLTTSALPGTVSATTIGVFGGNSQGSQFYDKMTLYSLKLSDDGTLIRDFVPAHNVSSGVHGLYELVSGTFYANSNASGGDFSYGTVVPMGVTAVPSYDSGSGNWKVSLDVTGGSGKLYVLVTNPDSTVTEHEVSTSATKGDHFDLSLTGLAANSVYSLSYKTVYAGSDATASDYQTYEIGDIFTGGFTLAKQQDANEGDGTPGKYLLSVDGGGTLSKAMNVNYTVSASSTAVAGQTYIALSGTATIPKGSSSVTIYVMPRMDLKVNADATVAIELVAASAQSSTEGEVPLTIKNGDTCSWWLFDSVNKTIADGIWQFAAKDLGSGKVQVETVNSDSSLGPVPSTSANLDWTKKVVSSTGTACSITSTYQCFYGQEARKKLGTVLFPDSLETIGNYTFYGADTWVQTMVWPPNLKSIGQSAFQNCSKITIDAATFPQWLTSISAIAFSGVKGFSGDLTLPALVSSDLRETFKGTSITSVRFGPGVTALWGGYAQGPVANCTLLTNVVFETSALRLYYKDVFNGCTKLKELDLSMVTKIENDETSASYQDGFFQDSAIERITFGTNLVKISSKVFRNAKNLKEVIFLGPLPDQLLTPYGDGATQSFTTIVSKKNLEKQNSSGKCWLDYATDGIIKNRNTTWDSSNISVDSSLRPLLTAEQDIGWIILAD